MPPAPSHLHYFGGIDPAPAQKPGSADGAFAALKARPRAGIVKPTANVADWQCEYIWAYRARGFSMRQWSGLIHQKHQHFGFTGLLLDPGSGGGGGYLMLELKSHLQLINGIETSCVPITGLSDASAGNSHRILALWLLSDPIIAAMWPLARGLDMLVDASHTAYQQAVEHGGVAWPKPFNERARAETQEWPLEKQWALKLLDTGRAQLEATEVARTPAGEWELTQRGAKKFVSAGKNDLAWAMIYAYIRFLMWLKLNESEFLEEEETGVRVWRN